MAVYPVTTAHVAAIPPDIRAAFARTLASGLIASALAGAGVWALERRALGRDDEQAAARVQARVEARVRESDATLAALTTRASANPALIRGAARDPQAARRLFDELGASISAGSQGEQGITIYDVADSPVAWTGRVVDLTRSRLDTAPGVFLASDPLGPRLVRMTPIIDRSAPASAERIGVVVAEAVIPGMEGVTGIPVSLRPLRDAPAGDHAFVVRAAGRGRHRICLDSAGRHRGRTRAVEATSHRGHLRPSGHHTRGLRGPAPRAPPARAVAYGIRVRHDRDPRHNRRDRRHRVVRAQCRPWRHCRDAVSPAHELAHAARDRLVGAGAG